MTAEYAWVSSHVWRTDIHLQKLRLLEHARRRRIQVNRVIAEVGSGLNGSRPKLPKALSKPQPARFGFEMADALRRTQGGAGGLVSRDPGPLLRGCHRFEGAR